MNWDRVRQEDRERRRSNDYRIAAVDDQARAWQAEWDEGTPYEKANIAVGFAVRRKTWPEDGNRKIAFAAAMGELRRYPHATKFEVAKAAVNAARADAERRAR
jgi:hypothetical protein